MRHSTAAFVCVIALLTLPGHASITSIEGSAPVEIKAKLGEESSFLGTVALFSDTQVHGLFMQSGVLKGDPKQDSIESRQVTLAATEKFDLDANTPKYLSVKITGVKEPGTYRGELSFYVTGQGVTPALKVPVTLIVRSDPAVTLCKGSDSITLQFVRCSCVGCFLAGFLEPGAVLASRMKSQGDSQSVCLLNGSLEPFSMDGALQAQGLTNKKILGNALTIGNSSPQPVDPQSKIVNIPLTFAAAPVADHYAGSIYLYSANKTLVTVPLDVNVKSGPLLPLLVLFLGTLLGRLLQYMKNKGEPQSDLLLALYRMEGMIAVSPTDQAVLQPMLQEIKSEIYAMQLDAAKTDLAAIQNRWTLLKSLRSLQTTLDTQKADPAVLTILNNIQIARQLIAAKQDTQAAAKVAAIETDVSNLQAVAVAPAAPQMAMFSLAKSQAKRAGGLAARGAKPEQLGMVPWWARILAWVTGAEDAFLAEVTLWLVRPLVFLLLVLALCAMGLQQLYLKNATFGSNPFSDYFGLFVWAISSDVASRSLSNLKTGS